MSQSHKRFRAPALAVAALAALAAPDAALAHGLGGVKDLPVPGWLFLFGGATVLVVSFIALGALWSRPRLDADAGRPTLLGGLQRVLLGTPLRIVLGALSAALLALVWATAALGDTTAIDNLAPTFVYIVFWLGMVPVSVLFGNVWSVLSPWKAVADAVAWLWTRLGRHWEPLPYPEGLGRWPAAALLFAFAALELTYTDPASPRALAFAILVYSWVTWLGAVLFGREAWFAYGDGFSAFFGFLARIAPFAVREGERGREIIVRPPLAGCARREDIPGAVAFVAVMLGSVAFDGFSRTAWWLDRLLDVRSPHVESNPALGDALVILVNLGGLLFFVLFVAGAYLVAVRAAEVTAGRRMSLAGVFLGSLIPIALVYSVAHYFSTFVIQIQFAVPLLSDPFGNGWDLLGSAGFQPTLTALTPNQTWYVQVAALVIGHVAGLAIAHDRAIALFSSPKTALETQYAMLALMVLYTVGGMWLLSQG